MKGFRHGLWRHINAKWGISPFSSSGRGSSECSDTSGTLGERVCTEPDGRTFEITRLAVRQEWSCGTKNPTRQILRKWPSFYCAPIEISVEDDLDRSDHRWRVWTPNGLGTWIKNYVNKLKQRLVRLTGCLIIMLMVSADDKPSGNFISCTY
jgi:hypothetical protein